MSNLEIDAPIQFSSILQSPSQIFTTLERGSESALNLLNNQSLVLTLQVSEIKSSLVVGQGPSGLDAGEEMKYSRRTDFVGAEVVYKGEANPGTLESTAGWRISRITFIGEDSVEEWANGNADFINMWSQRSNLAYS